MKTNARSIAGVIAMLMIIALVVYRLTGPGSTSSPEAGVSGTPGFDATPAETTPHVSEVSMPEPTPSVVEVPASFDATLAELKKGLPEDAASLLVRLVHCLHLPLGAGDRGEETFDEERRVEVEVQSEKYGCANVLEERDALLEKYKSDPNVARAFDEAEAFSDQQ